MKNKKIPYKDKSEYDFLTKKFMFLFLCFFCLFVMRSDGVSRNTKSDNDICQICHVEADKKDLEKSKKVEDFINFFKILLNNKK